MATLTMHIYLYVLIQYEVKVHVKVPGSVHHHSLRHLGSVYHLRGTEKEHGGSSVGARGAGPQAAPAGAERVHKLAELLVHKEGVKVRVELSAEEEGGGAEVHGVVGRVPG